MPAGVGGALGSLTQGVGDGRDERFVGRQPAKRVQVPSRHPSHVVVVQAGLRVAEQVFGGVQPKLRRGREHLGAEEATDRDLDAQLLAALAHQRVGVGLTRLDLAARELPTARRLRADVSGTPPGPGRRG